MVPGRFEELIDESIAVREAMRDDLGEMFAQVADQLTEALAAGHKLLFLGNGGSAADAQHVVAELVGRFERDRRGLPALSLAENLSTVTAVANDLGYDRVFARQLEAFGNPGDVVVALSTSGRSPSVVAALEHAREHELTSVLICGTTANPCAEIADIVVRIPSTRTAAIQEATMLFLHAVCGAIEERLGG